MRTTLDIDADILQAAKERAHREGITTGQMILVLARRGLNHAAAAVKKDGSRGRVPVIPSRGEIVTLEKVRRLMDEQGI